MNKRVVLLSETPVISRLYREDGFEPIPPFIPDDAEYGRGLQRFIGVCVDVVFIDSVKRVFYLVWRIAIPLNNEWWWIGGGEPAWKTPEEAAVANVKRETGLVIDPSRLTKRADNDYLWKDRAQKPQTIGCYMKGLTFTYEITLHELEQVKLDPKECREGTLRSFTRDELIAEEVVQPVLDLYDQVFPPLTR